jgi:hypothetical protein
MSAAVGTPLYDVHRKTFVRKFNRTHVHNTDASRDVMIQVLLGLQLLWLPGFCRRESADESARRNYLLDTSVGLV